MVDKTKFLNNSKSRLTKALFIEWNSHYEGDLAVYTLSNEDRIVDGVRYPSLRRLFIECDDMSETSFVDQYLYDWKQWESLQASVLKDDIDEWRTALKQSKIKKAIQRLEDDMASDSSSTSTASAKFLLEKVYGLNKSKVGRPKKETRVVPLSETISTQDDFSRVFKNVG